MLLTMMQVFADHGYEVKLEYDAQDASFIGWCLTVRRGEIRRRWEHPDLEELGAEVFGGIVTVPMPV